MSDGLSAASRRLPSSEDVGLLCGVEAGATVRVNRALTGSELVMKAPAVVSVVALLGLVGCGERGGDDATSDVAASEVATTSPSLNEPTSPAATSSLPPVESTTQTSSSEDRWAASLTKDLLYLTANGYEYHVDVYVPAGEGPFPVAVLFGGFLTTRQDSDLTGMAAAVVDEGMVAFAPTWLINPTTSPLPADLIGTYETATCALAYAQQNAAGFRGDPSRIVVSGGSAGAQPAAWVALGHRTELVPGCAATELPSPPVGAVLGDSEYFLHSEFFQHGFDTDLEGMQERVLDFVDPNAWPADLSAVFRIWSAEDATLSREVVDAWDEDGWLAQRDPDGTIRKDLEELGLLDDGEISHIDEGALLTVRLQEAGLDATHDIFPGGHVVDDKFTDLAAYLAEAAIAS